MKKIYTKPEIAVVDIKPTQLLSGSPEIPVYTDPVYTDPEKLIKNEDDVW
jgi:pyruvate/2-oxoglutarate dehydrogenase complex dihydrolipoamide dehydrogenase (E3) component